jgi:hypothetical protein
MNDDPEYIHEEKNNVDGTFEKLVKNQKGVIVCREIYNCNHRVIESLDYDDEGNFSRRAVYEQDGHRKPLKITAYDHNGDIIYVHERGRPPIFYGNYRAGKPTFMRSVDN